MTTLPTEGKDDCSRSVLRNELAGDSVLAPGWEHADGRTGHRNSAAVITCLSLQDINTEVRADRQKLSRRHPGKVAGNDLSNWHGHLHTSPRYAPLKSQEDVRTSVPVWKQHLKNHTPPPHTARQWLPLSGTASHMTQHFFVLVLRTQGHLSDGLEAALHLHALLDYREAEGEVTDSLLKKLPTAVWGVFSRQVHSGDTQLLLGRGRGGRL